MAQRKAKLPTWIVYVIVITVPLSFLPFVIIAHARHTRTPHPRLRFFQDMGTQPKLKAQSSYWWFSDGRSMRKPVPGAVAQGQAHLDDHFYTGGHMVDGKFEPLPGYPEGFEITPEVMQRGRERFDVYCSVCHGHSGDGQGLVHQRASQLDTSGWTQPVDLHNLKAYDENVFPNGKLFYVITNGARTMSGYGPQIPPADRWAIVAYVRALQLTQNATLEYVPEEKRPLLR